MSYRIVRTLGALGAVSIAATACSFVDLTTEAEQVRVSAPVEVESCERIGKTKTRTASKAWIFPRREAKVTEDLRSLARGDAAEMGGTDVAPLDEAVDGRQTFGIYKCPGQAGE